MKGYKKLESLAKKVFKASNADQTEVLFTNSDRLLTRFSKNSIHQNVMNSNETVSIRVVKSKKIGSASTNRVDSYGLMEALKKASEIANLQKEDEKFKSLPCEKPFVIEKKFNKLLPNELAEKVSLVVQIAIDKGTKAYGSLSRTNSEIAVFNSLGTVSYSTSATENLNLVAMTDILSGYGTMSGNIITENEIEKLTHSVCQKCKNKYEPIRVKPGKYDVFLEEYAIITMLELLNYVGFSGLHFIEGKSFLSGKIGKQVTGDKITIYDDGNSKKGLPTYFDFEGVKKKKVTLIEEGIGRSAVYDSYTANIAKVKNTGHSLPQPNLFGPYCLNVFMKAGDSNTDSMISSIKKGIYVTRFHYTNIVHPKKTVITGMTRDGTFLIENGEITRPIKNLRFTQNVLQAFKNVKLLSKRTKLFFEEGDVYVAPTAVIKDFNFTGVSEI